MPAFKTLLALCRVSNLPTVWMNVVAAVALTSGQMGEPFAGGVAALVVLAMSAFYAGGMAFNDYCDRHWDAQHQTFRPIPSGRVSARFALLLSAGLFGAGLALVSLAPNSTGLVAALALLVLILAYDCLHKRHWATVVLMAGTRLGVFAVAALSLADTLSPVVVTLALVQFFYTLLVTVVARLESRRPGGYGFPVIPTMIAGMGVIDGAVLAVAVSPYWLLAGAATFFLTRWAQRYVRGD